MNQGNWLKDYHIKTSSLLSICIDVVRQNARCLKTKGCLYHSHRLLMRFFPVVMSYSLHWKRFTSVLKFRNL